jgi:hypothetical protein
MPSDSTWAASLLQAEWDQHIALEVPFSERMCNVAITAILEAINSEEKEQFP